MKTQMISRSLLCAILGLGGPMAAMAQDAAELSADEIDALFETQRTRGLVLVPLEEEGTTAAVEDTANADGTEVAGADQEYAQIDSDAQVNIRIEFGFDSAALADSEKAKLVSLCEAMLASDIPVFRVVGHTDSSGSDEYNQRLSLLRAEEVQRHLINECGMPPERLEAVGVGEAFPFDPADPRSDANRRVEFQVSS